ncbi:MAG TPA: VanZ family protein [Thermoclostridium sp.]|nr:VanZ family protein [Thermoclostridium sp.]
MCKVLSWISVIIWMAVIFSFSSQVAVQSNQLSTGVTEVVVKTVEKVVPSAEINVSTLNNIIRKNAHFFSYLVLGVLTINAFQRSGLKLQKSIVFSFLVCLLYAMSDEIHQMYVPGRGAQVKDVLIDTLGAISGLLIYCSTIYIINKRRMRLRQKT